MSNHLRELIERWRSRALVAGQYSVECPTPEEAIADMEARTLTYCANALETVLEGKSQNEQAWEDLRSDGGLPESHTGRWRMSSTGLDPHHDGEWVLFRDFTNITARLDDLRELAQKVVDLTRQRDELLVALLSLRALIHDLGVQDADDSWNEAVARADDLTDAIIAKGKAVVAVVDNPCCPECGSPEKRGGCVTCADGW